LATRSTLFRLLGAVLFLLLPGCMLRDLGRNLKMLEEYAVLRGNVSDEGHAKTPVVVVLYPADDDTPEPIDDFMLARPGPFFFIVPQGTYRLAAFQDTSDDQVYDAAEDKAVVYDRGAEVNAEGGKTVDGLNLDFARDERAPLPSAFSDRAGRKGVSKMPDVHVGEVTTLSDPRFSEQNAQMGLWRPVEFLFSVGPGIYFLEPYDPEKIPVLYVHGALGNPTDFRDLIGKLDRTRFQPWLLYYPTAPSLENTAKVVDRWVQFLWVTHRFEKLAVVAHSMGGLVARAFINEDAGAVGVDLFVSLSTPWQGHRGAQLGVDQAPVVAPSWYDMAPGSPFLEGVLVPALPEGTEYDLLFSYGGRSWLNGVANDEAVTVASQLELRAQLAASKVYGFDATHRGILRSPEAAALVNGFLSTLEE
jgi:pimeloyl-ACP methyl ester carboxylesterase